MIDLSTKLRVEVSENVSGLLFNEHRIPALKEQYYFTEEYSLDGEAPKQFIRAYFYQKESGVRKSNPKTWFPYIAKTAEKWYPHESVSEYMINRIGQVLGLKMNEIVLCRVNGQIRFLSKYFLRKNEVLVHGAQICGEYLNDVEFAAQIANHIPTAKELFTFEFISDAIKTVFKSSADSIIDDLVRMIMFDAITGNNDRHFYNWGVIDTHKRLGKTPHFAPIYDSARGLFWNISDSNLVDWLRIHRTGGAKISNYIQAASPRVSLDGKNDINHFDLVKSLLKEKRYKPIIDDLRTTKCELEVLKMLKKEFYPFYIPERQQAIEIVVKERFKILREE